MISSINKYQICVKNGFSFGCERLGYKILIIILFLDMFQSMRTSIVAGNFLSLTVHKVDRDLGINFLLASTTYLNNRETDGMIPFIVECMNTLQGHEFIILGKPSTTTSAEIGSKKRF